MEMDTVQKIGEYINSFGFPIVACGAMFWYVLKLNKDQNKRAEELSKAIENNTSVIENVKTMLQLFYDSVRSNL